MGAYDEPLRGGFFVPGVGEVNRERPCEYVSSRCQLVGTLLLAYLFNQL